MMPYMESQLTGLQGELWRHLKELAPCQEKALRPAIAALAKAHDEIGSLLVAWEEQRKVDRERRLAERAPVIAKARR